MLLKCGPGKHGAKHLFAERGEKRMGQRWAKFGPRLGQKQKWARPLRSNPLICLARPFGGLVGSVRVLSTDITTSV